MATKEDKDKLSELADGLDRQEGLVHVRSEAEIDHPDDAGDALKAEAQQPTDLGARKYVHAAFFGGGILTAYLTGKVLTTVWNSLAAWPAVQRQVPQLTVYSEGERATWMMAVGAIVGVLVVFRIYRRPQIRQWADEVASELSRVTWPEKQMVSNGTLIVVAASAVATIYIALLDRLWSFLTTLVYGA